MISLESVNKWFGDHQVLRDCTLTIANGEVVVIVARLDPGKARSSSASMGWSGFRAARSMLMASR